MAKLLATLPPEIGPVSENKVEGRLKLVVPAVRSVAASAANIGNNACPLTKTTGVLTGTQRSSSGSRAGRPAHGSAATTEGHYSATSCAASEA